MERDKLEQKLWDIRISRDRVEILEVLAEFDRLTARIDHLEDECEESHTYWQPKCDKLSAENERLTSRLKVEQEEVLYLQRQWKETLDEKRGLQSHLNKICEHVKNCDREAADNFHEKGVYSAAAKLTFQAVCAYFDSLEKPIPRTTQGWKDRIWPEEPSEKPETSHRNRFCSIFVHGGAEKDCLTCNPKPSEKPTPIDLSQLEKDLCECGHSRMTHRDGDGWCDRSACGCKQFSTPICNPPKCEHKNIHDGVKGVYGKQWRLDCNVTLTGDF